MLYTRKPRRYEVTRERRKRPPMYRRGLTDDSLLPSFVVAPKMVLRAVSDVYEELVLGKSEIPGMAFLSRLHLIPALLLLYVLITHGKQTGFFLLELFSFPVLMRLFQMFLKKTIFRLTRKDMTVWTEIS